jgi:hypothetical protein
MLDRMEVQKVKVEAISRSNLKQVKCCMLYGSKTLCSYTLAALGAWCPLTWPEKLVFWSSGSAFQSITTLAE